MMESGHVYLPRGEEYVSAFVDQFTAFPAGKHDDMVDAATQALSYLLHACGEVGNFEQTEVRRDDFTHYAEDTLESDALYDIYG